MPPGVLAAVCWQTTTLRLFQNGFVGFPKWFRQSQGSVSSGFRATGEMSGRAEPRLRHSGYFLGDIGGSSTRGGPGSRSGVGAIACGGGPTRPRGRWSGRWHATCWPQGSPPPGINRGAVCRPRPVTPTVTPIVAGALAERRRLLERGRQSGVGDVPWLLDRARDRLQGQAPNADRRVGMWR